MHAIITSNAPHFVGAGRQPLAAIHNLPDNYSQTIRVDIVYRYVQVIGAPVAPSPVPALKRVRTVNRHDGLAMLERRKAHLAHDGLAQASSLERARTANKLEGLTERRNALLSEGECGSLTRDSSLERVRTINRLDGLAKLERRKARCAGEDFSTAFPLTGAVHASNLRRVLTINKSSGLAMLGRRSARDSDAGSLVLAVSEASTLKRVRTINKWAGLKILECRKTTQAHFAAAKEAQASS